MGRPANLTYLPIVWAPSAGYPAGSSPWSATPTKTAHPGAASVGLTPKTGVGAQNLNWVFNALAATDTSAKNAIASILAFLGQIGILNWPYRGTLISVANGGPTAACRDNGSKIWYVASGLNPSTSDIMKVAKSVDGGATFQDISTSYGTANVGDWTQSLASDDAGNLYALVRASNKVTGFYWNGSTWSHPETGAGFGFTTAFPHGIYDSVAQKFCFYTTTGLTNVNVVTAGKTDTAFTRLSFPSMPSGDIANVSDVTIATDGTKVLFMPRTWASAAFPYIVHLASPSVVSTATYSGTPYVYPQQCHAAMWDASTSLWVLAVDTAGVTTIVTSPDSITWTPTGASLPASMVRNGLAVLGAMWFAHTQAGDYYSLDTGVTWTKTEVSTVAGITSFFLAKSPNQMLDVGSIGVAGSFITS